MCSRTGYFRRVQSVRSFLEGVVDRQVLHDLEKEMISTAAQELRAGLWRYATSWPTCGTAHRSPRLAARRATGALVHLSADGARDQTVWYLIDKGLVQQGCLSTER